MRTPQKMMGTALAAALVGALAFGLFGCSPTAGDTATGDATASSYAADGACPSGAVELTVYLDKRCNYEVAGETPLEFVASEYVERSGRDQVTFTAHYVDAAHLLSAAAADPNADLIVCEEEQMAEALDSGLAYGGTAENSVRELSYRYSQWSSISVIRKKGAAIEMPETRLLGGGEAPGGSENRLMYLDTLDARIAVCAEDTWEGRATRSALAVAGSGWGAREEGLYSESSGEGGTFAESLEGKLVEAASAQEAIKMVRKGTADLAFVYGVDASAAKGVEVIYETSSCAFTPVIKGASITSSPNGAVARDFLQFFRELG